MIFALSLTTVHQQPRTLLLVKRPDLGSARLDLLGSFSEQSIISQRHPDVVLWPLQLRLPDVQPPERDCINCLMFCVHHNVGLHKTHGVVLSALRNAGQTCNLLCATLYIAFCVSFIIRSAYETQGVVLSALRNAGQTCICANRVFVAAPIYDQFAQLVKEKVKALRVGDGLDAGTTHGPLITPGAVDKVTLLLWRGLVFTVVFMKYTFNR